MNSRSSQRFIIKHFDVERLKKSQRYKKTGLILTIISLLTVLYLSYNPMFTLFVVVVWISLFISFLLFIGSIYQLEQEKKRKWFLINLIRDNYTDDLLELAKKIEYPYSILKQNIDYFEKNNELYFRFKTVKKPIFDEVDRI